jgi:hypothetical protein
MRRPPVTIRQLCAIADAVLSTNRTIDDSEWRERIKCQLVAQGWTYPATPTLISEAMTRVERTLARKARARPVPVVSRWA